MNCLRSTPRAECQIKRAGAAAPPLPGRLVATEVVVLSPARHSTSSRPLETPSFRSSASRRAEKGAAREPLLTAFIPFALASTLGQVEGQFSGLADRAFCTPPRRAGSTRPPKPRVRVEPQVRGRLLSPRSPMAAPPRSYTEGSRAAGPGSEECGSEEQLGPGEIGQFFLHGCANRLPRTAHYPLIYGGERPHNCGSELR